MIRWRIPENQMSQFDTAYRLIYGAIYCQINEVYRTHVLSCLPSSLSLLSLYSLVLCCVYFIACNFNFAFWVRFGSSLHSIGTSRKKLEHSTRTLSMYVQCVLDVIERSMLFVSSSKKVNLFRMPYKTKIWRIQWPYKRNQ